MKITLKDGSVKEYNESKSVIDIAADISEGLARVAMAGEVNGEVVDLRTVLSEDCELNILTFNDEGGRDTFRHTSSHILAQAVKRLYPDTKLAIGPAIAEHLHIPHCAWVEAIEEVDGKQITMRQNFGSVTQVSRMHYPCLVTVDKDICVPRLPSYRLLKETAEKPVRIVSFDDLPRRDLSRYGAIGSPTRVERIFAPEVMASNLYVEGNPQQKAREVVSILAERKYI